MVGVPRIATVVEVSREDLERGLIVPPLLEIYVVAFRTETEHIEATSSSSSSGYPNSSLSFRSRLTGSSLGSNNTDISFLIRSKCFNNFNNIFKK